jgi:hypothetical protein
VNGSVLSGVAGAIVLWLAPGEQPSLYAERGRGDDQPSTRAAMLPGFPEKVALSAIDTESSQRVEFGPRLDPFGDDGAPISRA